MNTFHQIVLLALVAVAAAGCAESSEPAPVPDTAPIEIIDGSALPGAGEVRGDIPLANGLEEISTTTTAQGPDPTQPTTPDQPPCRVVRVTDVLFGSGEVALTPEGISSIEDFARSLAASARIEIIGHTDNDPIAMGNQKLSVLRAEAVATALDPHLGRPLY